MYASIDASGLSRVNGNNHSHSTVKITGELFASEMQSQFRESF